MTRILQAPGAVVSRIGATSLLGLGTASPARLAQVEAMRLNEPLSCDTEQQRQFFRRIYAHSGVQWRASVLVDDPPGEYERVLRFFRARNGQGDLGPTTAHRMAVYAGHAPELAESAARQAIADAGISADAITHVLPVTCTGFFAPGLDVHLIRSLGLPAGVQRVQVGFMGCHGAFNALAMARKITTATPEAMVLVCCVELCSLHLAYGFDAQKLVANALFSDGAAAAVVGGGSRRSGMPRLVGSGTLLIPDSLDAMSWRIGDHGFEMTLSPRVPDLVRQHLREWVEEFLAGQKVTLEEIKALAIHPGGPKVLTAVAEALGLDESMLAASRGVLREHGNMSSATILFVLNELLKGGARGKCLALGFGPGLTAEAMLLEL